MTKARNLADLISDGVIGTTELADDVITPVQLSETGNYVMAQLDVNGAVTSDGLTVAGDAVFSPDNDGVRITGTNYATLRLEENDTTDLNSSIFNSSGGFHIYTSNDARTALTERFTIDHSTGDISFYEDTGTTAKFFWNASTERLGLGTSSPTSDLSVGSTTTSSGDIALRTTKTTAVITPSNSNAGGLDIDVGWVAGGQGPLTFSIGSTERMRIDSSGHIGISSDDKQIFWGAGSTAIDASSSNNRIRFYTNNSEAMQITSDGKLKLRTSDNLGNINTHPTYNTEGAYVNGFLNGGGAGPYPRYLDLAAVGDSSWGGIIRFLSNDNSNNTAVERMRVDASGKVGIGIAPVSQLTVKGAGANGTIKVIPDAVNAEASIGFYQDTTGANQTSRWVAGVGGWGQTNQFVIGTGSSPKLKIDTTGRVSKPYQPGFYAYSTGFSKSTGWQNVSQYMTSTGHNVGNHYTTTGGNTGRFTAPVTGRYVFHAGGWSSHNGGTNCQRYMYSIYVNNGNIGNGAGGNYSNGDTPMENGSFIVQLTAGQWVHLNAFSHVACTWGGNTHHFHWSGYLLG